MRSAPTPSLTAIVPATDCPPTLQRCLTAIRAGSRPPDELFVVTEPRGTGPAAARNEGARRAQGDVLVFVDSDVVVHPDALARIEAAFARDPALAAVFGSYDDRPPEGGTVAGFRNLLHHHVHQSAAGPAATFWAGLGAVRRDVFLDGGGFDAERYLTPSIEDVELGGRLAAGGARIVLDPAILGIHLKAWSFGEMIRTDFARRGLPWVELLAEGEASKVALNLGWRHRLSAAAALFATAAAVLRHPAVAAAMLVPLLGLNRRFYMLLLRRRGPRQALIGIGLHVVHHLTAVAAVIAGVLRAGVRRA